MNVPAIPRGMFSGFGTGHVTLAVVFAIGYEVLGQLGWVEFYTMSYADRLTNSMLLPIDMAISFAAVLAAVAAQNTINGESSRSWRYPVAVLAASLAGTLMLELLAPLVDPRSAKISETWRNVPAGDWALLLWNFLKALYMCILVVALHAVLDAGHRASATLHATRLQALDSERAVFEGELSAMLARVDPDLLFDSLQKIDAAYARDPAAGQTRLEALIRFLRAALPGKAASTSTVSGERELIEAYVALVAPEDATVPPLRFDADPAALRQEIAPMLMLPLLRWALAGGSPQNLSISAQCGEASARAYLEVVIENLGGATAAAHGEEEQMVRTRLARLYGEDAGFQFSNRRGRRRVAVTLPLAAGKRRPDIPVLA